MEHPRSQNPTFSQLQAENAALRGQVAELTARVAELDAALKAAQAEIERLKRARKRQATPFSKDKRKANPKRPGRKPGEGPFRNREAPDRSELSEPATEVPVTEPVCEFCGGELEAHGTEFVTNTEIPAQPKPEIKGYDVQIYRCKDCGRTMRGKHPDVAPDQTGATAHRVGTRLMAAGHLLRLLGVTSRKVGDGLRDGGSDGLSGEEAAPEPGGTGSHPQRFPGNDVH